MWAWQVDAWPQPQHCCKSAPGGSVLGPPAHGWMSTAGLCRLEQTALQESQRKTKNVPRVMECPRGHVHPGSGSLLLGPEQGVRVRQPPVTLPPHNALPGDPATGRAEVKAIPGPVTAFGGGRGVNLKGSPGPHWGRTWVGAGFGERSDFSSRPRPTALLRAQREHDQLPTLVEGDKHVTGTFGAALSDTKLPGSAWTIWK